MRILNLLVAASVLAAASVAARADDAADIRAAYTKITAAMKAKNLKAIIAMEAPGYTETSSMGTMNAKQANAMMESNFKMVKVVKAAIMTPLDIKVNGKSATVKTKIHFVMVMTDKDGQMGPKGKDHVFTFDGTSTDVLVKTAKGWLFKSTKETSRKLLMDGKPMPEGPPAKRKR